MGEISITVRKHKSAEHYVATSADIEGFIAQGRTYAQLLDRVPVVMLHLLSKRTDADREQAPSYGFQKKRLRSVIPSNARLGIASKASKPMGQPKRLSKEDYEIIETGTLASLSLKTA